MCGIAGYVGVEPPAQERVQACLRLMRHRGPDHAASQSWRTPDGRHVALLHTRLNIIDLSDRANQPFGVGSKWMVYNGELYNYQELKADLAARGTPFRTESDTEVLLRTIDRLGWDGLDRCEGMWAFAVYDEADGSLALCRDRFGEKPLYLYRDHAGLYFSSESQGLAALLGRRLEVNLEHLFRYFTHGYKALYKTPQTFFQGLTELPPATVLRIGGDGRERRWTYWEPHCQPDAEMSYEEAVAGVRERLIRAVELRLRADVPLAFCMSGGMDSLSLISIAKRVFDYDVHGFTFVNADPRYNEQELVDHAVKELRVRHTAIPAEPAPFLARLRALVRAHDAPVSTISYYAHWLVMEQVARHGYRIAVSGTAADELLTGYYDHFLLHLAEIRDDPRWARERQAWQTHIRPLVRNPCLQDPELFVADPGFRDHIAYDAAGFAEYLTDGWSEPFSERTFGASLLRNRMLNELFHESVPVILHEDDLNAMSFSIENRSPFLDRPLMEFCYRIPSRELIRDGFAKVVLRDAMRGIVPERVLSTRRKVGFNAPIESFLDAADPAVREALLADSPIFEHVRRDRIAALLEKRGLPNSESKFLFYFLNSKLFLEECAEPSAHAGAGSGPVSQGGA